MLAEELKSTVDTLSLEGRHELSCYLTKLDLQNDADYWKTIRQRTTSENSSTWVPTDSLQESK